MVENAHQQHSYEQKKKDKKDRERFNRNQWKNENEDLLKSLLGDENPIFPLLYICI